MHRDAWLLLIARVLRNFAYGYLVVVLAIYLDLLGLSPFEIGVVLTGSAIGSAVLTIGWSLLADRVGRRRSVCALALLMVVGGVLFVVAANPWLLAIAAFAGSLSVAGTDTGTFVTVDQSMLPQLAADDHRTSTFAIQNIFATLALAIGSLAAGAVGLFSSFGLQGADAYRPLFILFALIGLSNYVLFARLSAAVEVPAGRARPTRRIPTRFGLGESRAVIGTIVALNVIDALAGGLMLQSLVAYWFYVVCGLETAALALMFFWMNALSVIPMIAAGWIARRIGLMNTMLLSHVPQGVFGLLMPFAPTASIAMAFWLVRNTLGFVFFPIRQSYFMGIVPSTERSAAAGYTTVARNVAATITPALTGAAFSIGLLSLPFVVAGLMKLGYDALAFALLRGERPPEELRGFEEILTVDVASNGE